jgi:HK97 family phage prohead protease
MPQREHYPAELREANLDKGLVTALLVPYGQTTMAAGYPAGERFLPGSFTKTLKHRESQNRDLMLLRAHDLKRPVGRAVWVKDTAEGPVAEFQLGLTSPAGKEALAELRDGLLSEVSVGFHSVREQLGEDGAREITEAALHEASLVPIGAYEGAKVLSVREAGLDLSWLKLPDAPNVDPGAPIITWR